MILILPICKCKFSFFLFSFDECTSNEETNENVPLQKISIHSHRGDFSNGPPPFWIFQNQDIPSFNSRN